MKQGVEVNLQVVGWHLGSRKFWWLWKQQVEIII